MYSTINMILIKINCYFKIVYNVLFHTFAERSFKLCKELNHKKINFQHGGIIKMASQKQFANPLNTFNKKCK